MGDSTKKLAVGGLAAILLVAMVVAVAVTANKNEPAAAAAPSGAAPAVTTSTKAVDAICSPTDYKATCKQSLAGSNSTDPKALIRTAFESTVKNIRDAVRSSAAFKAAAADELTKGALRVCDETLDASVEDLERSFAAVGDFNPAKLGEYAEDVRTWLSASIAYHEACLDAFDNTTGETGEKMKELLKASGELLSNGLAMVTDFSDILGQLDIASFTTTSSRRLLGIEFPSFVSSHARKLMVAGAASLKPNVTVSKDGSGDFGTITDALNTLPKKTNETFVIYVKAGVYKETVTIPRKVNNVMLIGDGPLKTRIVGNKNFADGVQTFHTCVLAVNGEGFIARDIGIENTAGPAKHQAVAVRVSGDKAIFYNVHMDGYQDTLYAHAYRHFYRDCLVSGTIDFIFGDAVAVFQNSRLVVRKPLDNQACMVTAQGRKDKRSVGVTVIQNCDVVAEPAFLAVKPALAAYLGRPWKEYSRTIIMQSNIDGFIAPEGWAPWMGSFGLDTLYYGEYQNRGAGSKMDKRVTWKGMQKITPNTAQTFTPQVLFADDAWVKTSGFPYVGGFVKV